MLTNQLTKINEQLFTELAPEQAEILEGGLRVQLTRVECLQAGDFDGANIIDEVYVRYNGKDANSLNGPNFTVGQPTNMNTGDVVQGFLSLGGSSGGGSTTVRFIDKDGPNLGFADNIGSFVVTSSGFQQQRLVGGRYLVNFNAFQ